MSNEGMTNGNLWKRISTEVVVTAILGLFVGLIAYGSVTEKVEQGARERDALKIDISQLAEEVRRNDKANTERFKDIARELGGISAKVDGNKSTADRILDVVEDIQKNQ